MSWTGSEQQRRPQGLCTSNGKTSRNRFGRDLPEPTAWTIPAGTWVTIRQIANGSQRRYRTKQDLTFENPGLLDRFQQRTFHHKGWWIIVATKHLQPA